MAGAAKARVREESAGPGTTMESVAPRAFGREGRRELVPAAVLLLLPLVFFLSTARRDLEGSDSAELVAAAWSLGIPHATGYPLYTWIGRAAIAISPLDPARTMNLLSALFGGAAVVLFAFALRELTGRLLPAAAALSGLALGRSIWFVSSIAEVYTLHLLLTAATLFFLFRWGRSRSSRSLLLAVYFAALGAAHHGSTVLFLPGYVLYVVLVAGSVRRAARFAPLLLAVPLAFTVYFHHPIRHASRPAIDSFREIDEKVEMGLIDEGTAGSTFGERFLYKTLGGGPSRKLGFFGEAALRQAGSLPSLFRASVGTLLAAAGIAGLAWGLRRGPRPGRALLAWCLLANTTFFLNLRTEDLEDFLVPSFLFLAAGAALFFAKGTRPIGRPGTVRTVLLLFLSLVTLANGAEIARAAKQAGGYRHGAPTLPRERELLALDFPRGSALLLPWGRATVLRYLQTVEGLRTDIEVRAVARSQIDRAAPPLLERGPVFADDAGAETRSRCKVTSFGPLFRIDKSAPEGVSR
jgi:hypothetical protein